jgi:hypothetical protein
VKPKKIDQKKPKLELRRETIRRLTSSELERVNGGKTDMSMSPHSECTRFGLDDCQSYGNLHCTSGVIDPGGGGGGGIGGPGGIGGTGKIGGILEP